MINLKFFSLIDEENPLLEGKLDLEKIEDIYSNSWDCMEYSVCISGNLSEKSRKLMYRFEEPSFIGDNLELWHFQLLKRGKQ